MIDVDKIKINRAIAEITKGGSSARVTGYDRQVAIEALDYLVRVAMARRQQLADSGPDEKRRGVFAPRNDGATGQRSFAAKAIASAPAPHHLNGQRASHSHSADDATSPALASAHPNSEGGAKAKAPVMANMATPRPSLPKDDGDGQSGAAQKASAPTPSLSSPITAQAGQCASAVTAIAPSPARAVAPTDAQKAMNRRIAGELVESIMNRQVRYGGSAKVWGDLHQTDLDAVVLGNAKDAARSAFDATFADALRQRWGRDYVSRRVRDRFSAKELQEIEDDVRRCGAKVARTVARETRGTLPAA